MSIMLIWRIRSFRVTLYTRDFAEFDTFKVPFSVVAPFTNRIFSEVLQGGLESVGEPWYQLSPHYPPETLSNRSPLPAGPTSLLSRRYDPDSEAPPRVTLHPEAELTYFTVSLLDFDRELFSGDYSVDDIFVAGAEYLARNLVKKGQLDMQYAPFYYSISASRDEVRTAPPELFPPQAFEVEGVFQLPLLADDRKRIEFRKVRPEPLPECDPAAVDLNADYGRGQALRNVVRMSADVYQRLRKDLPLHASVEDGGYLVGQPYRQPGSPEDESDPDFRWLLEISDVQKVEGAWGGPALLLFTGDSWSKMNRRMDTEFRAKKLVGWFHTHLFAGSDEFGLSGLDLDLHRRFLTKPWQVAVLLNVTPDGEREVRCFQRGPEGDLVECRFEVN